MTTKTWRDANKERYNAYQRENYAKTKEERRIAIYVKKAERRNKLIEIVNSIKSQPCIDCGVSYPPIVMDFDHVRGTKEFNISSEIRNNVPSEERLKKELDKCEVVCSNCHRIRTAKRAKEL